MKTFNLKKIREDEIAAILEIVNNYDLISINAITKPLIDRMKDKYQEQVGKRVAKRIAETFLIESLSDYLNDVLPEDYLYYPKKREEVIRNIKKIARLLDELSKEWRKEG